MKPKTLDALTLGFGTTAAMWAVAYLGRLPARAETAREGESDAGS